jgi:putative addiction module component (TIGR02574 family)
MHASVELDVTISEINPWVGKRMASASSTPLTNSERLAIVTEYWNEIAKSPHPIELPEEVLVEAQRRADELAAESSMAIDEDEVGRQVDG